MSRTKHTDPPRIRAPRRVRAPHEPRGHADRSFHRQFARALKEAGIVSDADTVPDRAWGRASLPRVVVKRPRAGWFHPANRAEILCLLRFFGEGCCYGVSSIELLQGSGASRGDGLLFGSLMVPGRIVLYDQPRPPWFLPGRLSAAEQGRLRIAGAMVETIDEASQSIVSWPGDSLRDFILFDVLMHEIGHHLLQHYKGKRGNRIARTRDHEALADRFAARCRALYCSNRGAPR